MKLTSRKFLFWRTQLLPFLWSQELLGYVDGSLSCPPATIAAPSSSADSSTIPAVSVVPNPAYQVWVKQDQLILSLVISSMSDEVLYLALGRNMSAAMWESITTALGSSSQAKCLNLLAQFQLLRQGNSTTADYLGRAGVLVESLIQAGRPLSLMEQNLYVIRGLRPELKTLAASFTSGSAVTLAHLSDYLQANEFILVDDFPAADEIAAHSAFYAGNGRGVSSGGGRHQQQSGRGSSSGGRGGRGGRQNRGGRGGPRCQICRSHGHSAMYCFKWYHPQLAAPQAHVAVSGDTPPAPDTGATAHATPDTNMLGQSEEYTGSDVLHVGNGAGFHHQSGPA
ncbi:PREDICTED: uncharacterized protein LOC109179350 [Ipomoea nil]|uniref:uncharacterized protein LOC109179350 n=1 Tax=Ipomoea nil TaxID=35883 RepID=UPI000901A25A|nr:PREDICTED: uncharacterized protein LOC109179350 [Ipomoea nil]